jgi:NAD-dependent histone deacetylase SIR2
VRLINQSERILVLTGAGISALLSSSSRVYCFDLFFSFFFLILNVGVSCGIPDFRSQDGLYASLKSEGKYELDDPQQM